MALLLIGLFSLRAARRQGNDASDLSNLRQTLTDSHLWSSDHQGTMVNVGLPDDPDAAWFYGPNAGSASLGMYRSQAWMWPRILAQWSGEPSDAWHTTRGPSDLGGALDLDSSFFQDRANWSEAPSRFTYSETMLTDSRAWKPRAAAMTAVEFASHYKSVRFDEIASPAQKGVLVNRDRTGSPIRWHVGFADGHASLLDPDSMRPAPPHPTSGSHQPGKPVLHTENGLLGVDY